MILRIYYCKQALEPLQRLFTSCIVIYDKKLQNESEIPCSASGETFLKNLDKSWRVCYAYAPEEERAAGKAPDVLDIPTSVPRMRGR